jgi:hypothetical protein
VRYTRPETILHRPPHAARRFAALFALWLMLFLSGATLTFAATSRCPAAAVGGTPGSIPSPASVARDTMPLRTASTDTLTEETLEPVWTKEELKDALERQSRGIAEDGKTWKNTKNPRMAMLCALLVPGLGQIYNERPLKALIAFGAETFYLSGIVLNKRYAERRRNIRDRYDYENPAEREQWLYHDTWAIEYDERAQDWMWWSAGIIAIVVLDAYVDAHLHDMRIEVGMISRRDEVSMVFAFRF